MLNNALEAACNTQQDVTQDVSEYEPHTKIAIIMTRRERAVLEMTHFIKHVQHNAKCINAT